MARGSLLRFMVVVLLTCSGSVLEGDVFNIKILSENTPDLTDLPSFAAIATDNWTEYYEPLPADPNSGGITRTHTERITYLPHKYNVNCGGAYSH